MAIRNAAKAIIMDGGKVLLNRNRNEIGDMCYGMENGEIYFDLPGGGQNQYETLEEAVLRECLEETGYAVQIDRLAAIYEELSMNEQFRAQYADYAHKVHFVFLCRLTDAPRQTPAEVDMDMLGSEWVPMEEVQGLPLYPRALARHWAEIMAPGRPVHLKVERV